jgi:hypothetical protein
MPFIAAIRRAVVLLLLAVPFVALPPPMPVAACVPAATPRPGTTPPPPPATLTVQQAAAQAQVIFRGHPIRWEDASYKYIDGPSTRTTFVIDTLWKGPPTPEVTLFTFSCGGDANPFRHAVAYIIYANPGGPAGDLAPLTNVSHAVTPYDQEDQILGPGTLLPTIPPNATLPPPSATPTLVPQPTPVTPVGFSTRSAAIGGFPSPSGAPGAPNATQALPGTPPTIAPQPPAATPTASIGAGAAEGAGEDDVRTRAMLAVIAIAAAGGATWMVLARRRRRYP